MSIAVIRRVPTGVLAYPFTTSAVEYQVLIEMRDNHIDIVSM